MEKTRKHIVHTGKVLFILLLIFTTSCEEPVELDLEGTETKLVLTSHISPEQKFEAYISKSLFPGSKNFSEYPMDAEVQIYKGNEVLGTLWPVSQPDYPFLIYQSKNLTPEIDVEYTIRASLPGLEKVNATSKIPIPARIKEVEVSNIVKEYPKEEDAIIDSTVVDYIFDLSIQIDAANDVPTYYHLNVYYENVGYTVEGTDTIRMYTGKFQSILLDDPTGSFGGLKHHTKGILLKQDEGSENLVLNFNTKTPNAVESDQDLFDRLYIDLRTVSKDYFLYHTQLTLQYKDGADIDEYDRDVLNDPILLYNNVNNGYGIFAGYSLSRDSVFIHPE